MNVTVWHKNENIDKNTYCVYPSVLTNKTLRSEAFLWSFSVNDITKYTDILKLMYEWFFTGKKMDCRCMCEQRFFIYNGKVIPVIYMAIYL